MISILTIESTQISAATFDAVFTLYAENGLKFVVTGSYKVFAPKVFNLLGEQDFEEIFYTLDAAKYHFNELVAMAMYSKKNSDLAGLKWLSDCLESDIFVKQSELYLQEITSNLLFVSKDDNVEQYKLYCFDVEIVYTDLDMYMSVTMAGLDVFSFNWAFEDPTWPTKEQVLAQWLNPEIFM
jgi:hypothetical protein